MFYKTPYGSHYHTSPSCPAIAGHQAESCSNTAGLEPCSICMGGSDNQASDGMASASGVTGTGAAADATTTQDYTTTDTLNGMQESDVSDEELTPEDVVTKSAELTEAGRDLEAHVLPETPPKKTFLQRLSEIHTKILEFMWQFALPSPKKRWPWWYKYLGIEKPRDDEPWENMASWSGYMNKIYGPMFGEYNPYLSEEDRKRMAIRPNGPINNAVSRLGDMVFPDSDDSKEENDKNG